MHTFDYKKYNDYTWDNEIIAYLTQIHEYRGKQELYAHQKPVELSRLIEIARIQSTESSNSIEGIVTTKPRLKGLMEDKISPETRHEEEILGYRNVLALIHENYDAIPVRDTYILQLYKELYKYTPFSYGGKFKTTSNEIAKHYPDGSKETLFVPLEPYDTPDAVKELCLRFDAAVGEGIVDPLILISIFILDFLCIHPFNDGNGRMSRLLTLLLLYRSGYKVGQFISIERAIEETKGAYYDAIARSNQGWHSGENDPKPFIRYMLGIILACYRELEERVTLTDKVGNDSTSYDVVREYAIRLIGSFTKQEVLEHCPSLGSSSVESSLKKLVEDGTLQRLGAGRATRYTRSEGNE